MRMRTLVENDMRSLENKANEKGIKKEQVVSTFASPDGTFVMVYYEED